VPEDLVGLYFLNPMALVVSGMRWAVLDLPPPPLFAFPLAVGVATALLVSGYLFFRRRETTFADTV
jgi:lipopolysaccharide transport system permease protein